MSKNEGKTAFLTNVHETQTAKIQMPPSLVLLAGESKSTGRHWILQNGKVVLGRLAPADIQIEVASLSKAHAQFEVKGDVVTVMDLGSTNKTFLNDELLTPHKAYPLKNNDRLRTGSLIFKFLQKGIISETAEKARMEEELTTARHLQASIFPAQPEARYHSVTVGGRYRTATECGGDWWWHWSKGDRVFAIIGDATGHGAGAAMLTSAARSAVAILEDDATADLEKMYRTLTRSLNRVANGSYTMSAFLVEVDAKLGRMRYINGSHPFPVMLPTPFDATKGWRTLDFITGGLSKALGNLPEQFSVEERPFPRGSRLVLLTDGLTERQNSYGECVTDRAFFNGLTEAHKNNPHDQSASLDHLLKESDLLALSAPQVDDITVVALDFN